MATAKKLPSGQWRVLVYSHTETVNGKQKRIYESFTAPTKKEAEYMGAEFAFKKKQHIHPSDFTLGEAIDDYIALSAPTLSKSSIATYQKIKRNYFLDIMDVKLKNITSDMLQQAVNKEVLRPSKKYKNTNKTLSPKTVNNAYGLISTVIKKYNPNLDINIKLPKRQNKRTYST